MGQYGRYFRTVHRHMELVAPDSTDQSEHSSRLFNSSAICAVCSLMCSEPFWFKAHLRRSLVENILGDSRTARKVTLNKIQYEIICRRCSGLQHFETTRTNYNKIRKPIKPRVQHDIISTHLMVQRCSSAVGQVSFPVRTDGGNKVMNILRSAASLT